MSQIQIQQLDQQVDRQLEQEADRQPAGWQSEVSDSVEGISGEQIRSQIDLILQSKHFRQAKSLEKFLRYSVAKRLAGSEGDLKEYTIGVEVFQRGADYDPRKDAVVRVQANVLRKRLAGYYDDEGALDEIIIEMPKGHYVPQFHRRLLKSDLALSEASVTTVDASELMSTSQTGNRPQWKIIGLVAATFVLGLATALLWQNWFGRPVASGKGLSKLTTIGAAADKNSADPAFAPLWEKFLEPGVDNILAYGTPQFFVSSGLYLRDVEVNSPEESDAAARLKLVQRTVQEPFRPIEVYTGVGETHGVYLLTKFFTRMESELRVTRSRMVGWNEMKNSNIIFLSSMRFNTLAKELPFPSDFAISPGVASKLVNLHPQSGEPSTYGGEGNGDYAVITVWPGKLHQRRILVLSGSTTWATLALAEYVTDVEYLRQLNQHLEQCRAKSGLAKHPPYFQVLVRTEVKDNQPINISYVTHHDFEIAESTAPSTVSTNAGTENIARLSSTQTQLSAAQK